MLKGTGLWTTTWMFFFAVSVVCLVWLHIVARRMIKARAPELLTELEEKVGSGTFESFERKD
jgi:NNP family nitrate/nitrite transporter-like MFS transporter